MNQAGGSRGLFVRAAAPPPIGTELTVQFVLPDGSDLVLPGRVAHRLSAEEAQAMGEHPGMGVQFTHMSEEQAQRIQDIMATAESRQSMRNSAPTPVDVNGDAQPTSEPAEPPAVAPVIAPLATPVAAPAVAPAAAPARIPPAMRSPLARPSGAQSHNGVNVARPNGVYSARPVASPVARRSVPSGAISGAPQDPRLLQAASMLERGRFDLAERTVAEVLQDNPDLAAARILAHLIAARRARAQFSFEEAIERYRAVLKFDPRHPEAQEQVATLPSELAHSIALYERIFGKAP
jgi:hypothetical protein